MVCIKNCPELVRIKREFLERKHILLCCVECISPFASFLSFLAKITPGLVSKSMKHLYLAFLWCSTPQLQHSHYCQKEQSLALCRDFFSVVWVTLGSVLRFRLMIIAQSYPWRNIPKKEVN